MQSRLGLSVPTDKSSIPTKCSDIPTVASRVWSSRSPNTIHCNISGLLASLSFHLLTVFMAVLALPSIILISFYPGVPSIWPSLYQEPLSRGSDLLMPLPTHIGAYELSPPPMDSKSSESTQHLFPTFGYPLPSFPIVPLVNVCMSPFPIYPCSTLYSEVEQE